MKRERKNKIGQIVEKVRKGFLDEWEVKVLRTQIRSNSFLIEHLIHAIDLLVNKERCPKDANTLAFLRERLSIAIAENDTFRKVLWRHTQLVQSQVPYDGESEAASFLLAQIKTRERALISQMARK